MNWKAGVGRAAITPEMPLWLAGYGFLRPSEGKRHDLWVKALALEDAGGTRALLVTSDLVGFSKEQYERLTRAFAERFGLERARVMLTSTHNHCAPVTTGVLPDFYPLDEAQWRQVDEYTRWMEARILDAAGEALSCLAPARLSAGEGRATFAANRRENTEEEAPAMLAEGRPFRGVVDHSLPLLTVSEPDGRLLAAIFGYACHPVALADNLWCGDYAGHAMATLEQAHPGMAALFWTGCGGDQNPIPRRAVEHYERCGGLLAQAVEDALRQPLRPLEPRLQTAFEFVTLDFERPATREELERDTDSAEPVRARWARRMLPLVAEGRQFPQSCEYGVQAWRLGDQLWIALGAEAVVDYSLRLKAELGPQTWVCGYAHDMVGYVPSRRVREEGGYEADYLFEYGWLAYRWAGDVEDRVAAAVHRAVAQAATAWG